MKRLVIIICSILSLVCLGSNTKVKKIIDGDTFKTESGEVIRLIGINAPEISDIFGIEAKDHLSNLIYGRIVTIQPDNISNDKDRYSRLLRYVTLDSKDINKQMLIDGYATAFLKFHFEKEEEYRLAQLSATKNNLGMWGNNEIISDVKSETRIDNFRKLHSPKTYFIAGSVLVLLCFGIYFYMKK
jgi:micrococcal nuclease